MLRLSAKFPDRIIYNMTLFSIRSLAAALFKTRENGLSQSIKRDSLSTMRVENRSRTSSRSTQSPLKRRFPNLVCCSSVLAATMVRHWLQVFSQTRKNLLGRPRMESRSPISTVLSLNLLLLMLASSSMRALVNFKTFISLLKTFFPW
jgi:hypothetical protein